MLCVSNISMNWMGEKHQLSEGVLKNTDHLFFCLSKWNSEMSSVWEFRWEDIFICLRKKKSISHALDSCETLMFGDMSILLADRNCTLTIPGMGLEVGWAPHLIRWSGSSELFLQIRYNSCSPQAPKAMYQCNNPPSIPTFTNNCKDLLIWFSSAAPQSAECWLKWQLRRY